jgi:hypothetical protein
VASSDTGIEGCTPETPTKSSKIEIKATNSSMMITTVLLKYLESGPSTLITIASARGDAKITRFRAHRRRVNNRASTNQTTAAVQQASIWQPRTAMVPFTRPAGAAVLTITALKPGATTTTTTPEGSSSCRLL